VTGSTPLLRARDVTVRFGGVHALEGADLEVQEGQLVGLIGPNGAGKTTFVDAVTGFVPYTGLVELDGRDLGRLPPHARARAGLARTWQSTELFDDLSIRENLAVAAHRTSVHGAAPSDSADPDGAGSVAGGARTHGARTHGARLEGARRLFRWPTTAAPPMVDETLDVVELGWAAEMMPSELSQGQRKVAGVARAIAMQPRLLCLDEPAAGLDTGESEELGRRLRRLADAGTSMLLIDHDMGLVLSICDQVFVLEFGKRIAAGPPDTVRRDPTVITAYLGSASAPANGDGSDVTSGGST
jgi:branched-chain amino acid transport system ATP-binding protein